ncbi:dihydroorotate dehydrogenase-like protein [Treponema sp.]
MADLRTKYLGLELKNPLIVAASGLTASVEGVKKAIDAGAGAVVLKSLFEEQLRSEMDIVSKQSLESSHPEAAVFIEEMGVHAGAGAYLDLIRSSKAIAGKVPIIASVNCIEGDLWVDFAEQIEAAGASALELNVGIMPLSAKQDSKELEDLTVSILRTVSVRTDLPLAVKIGPYFTNPANLVERLSGAGAGAVVLFNRFYRLDLDLDKMALKAGPMRSGEDEYHESLRWICNMYGSVAAELVGGTGIHSGETALKFIAGGATTVQICSALYKGGWAAMSRILLEMEKRMNELQIASADKLRGRLSRRSSAESEKYERLQYIKALTGIS